MNVCRIERLRLYRFRNYAETVVDLEPGLNVFAGRNAQGKTNLLEAIATLTLTRSPRTSVSSDLVRWGEPECQIDAAVERLPAPVRLSLRLSLETAGGRVARTTTVDTKPRPARALLGVCPVVIFWPDDLQLVKAGPENRRRLLDVVLSQLDARVAEDLIRYRRCLEQRNAVLRRLREGERRATGALDAFDSEFVERGARIRGARARLTAMLGEYAAAALRDVGDPGEELALAYTAGGETVDGGVDNFGAIAQHLADEVGRRRNDEIARGTSLVGPHRDDLEILLGGRHARAVASQGQQRSIVLALKLAEVRHVSATAGVTPVMLLDDVLSELDQGRRDALLGAVAGAGLQTLITTAEPAMIGGDVTAPAALFDVEAGRVTRR